MALYEYLCQFPSMCRLEEIGAAATKEYSLEKAMEKMGTEWEEMEFIFLEYRDTVRQSPQPGESVC